MTTTTRTKKQSRTATISKLSDGRLVLWLQCGEGWQGSNSYLLTPLSSDFGTAFHLHKGDKGDGKSDEYDVLLNDRESSCTCKGSTYKGHCKHVEALTALCQSDKL